MLLPDNKFYRGDSIKLYFQLFKNKSTGEFWNLTNYSIRAIIYKDNVNLKRVTSNVTGGSDEQILILDAIKGEFLVNVNDQESLLFVPGTYKVQIKISISNESFTVFEDSLIVKETKIDWRNV